MIYLSNMAAVYFEQKEYQKCIDSCQKAIDLGRIEFADFKAISRAFHRIGNAHMKLEQYDKAVEAYDRALTEFRNPESLNALRNAEKLKKKKDEENYVDKEKGENAKNEGNEHFRAGRIPEAIKAYSEAIKRDPLNAVYYSNRAAAYTKLGEYPTGLKDCDKCLELDPNFVKGYSRKGNIQFRMKLYHKCLETYDKGLKLDPDNQELLEGIQATMAAINVQQQAGGDETVLKRAMQDPEIQEILRDPALQQMLQEMQREPKSINAFMRDPLVASKINKLVAEDVLQVK